MNMKTARSLLNTVIQVAMLFAIVSYPPVSVAEEWTGTLKREGKQKEKITFVVKTSDKGPFIKKMVYAGTSFEFKQQEFTEDALILTWMPGDKDVKCRLKKNKDYKYAGDCHAEDSGSTIKMQINAKNNGDESAGDEAEGRETGR